MRDSGLEQAIKAVGGISALARALGLSQPSVSAWSRVPAERVLAVEAIAAVPGVDGIFVGPADLATSMGYPGNPAAPEVQAAILDAIVRIRKAGKPAGILSLDPDFLKRAAAAGSLFTAVDVDQAILLRGARALAKAWKG